MSASYSPITATLNTDINNKLSAVRQSGSEVVVLKMFANNLEYQKIQNFPQHGLQFVAEVT